MDVPQGTAADVLAWVGDDPARAQAALDAEYVGANRSTLIAKLEPIAAKEASVSEETAVTEEEVVEEVAAPEPVAAADIEVDLAAPGTFVGAGNVRDADVEVPADNYQTQRTEAQAAEEEAPVDAGGVDFMQLASTGSVVVVRFDDNAVKLDANQAVALAKDLRRALAGVNY